MSSLCDCEKFANLKKLCEYFAAESEIQRSRSEKLEAALFNIYAAPNDIPFIKAQIDAVLDINEYRQALEENNDPST